MQVEEKENNNIIIDMAIIIFFLNYSILKSTRKMLFPNSFARKSYKKSGLFC